MNSSTLARIKTDLDIVNLAKSYGMNVRDTRQGGITDCPACEKKGHLYLYRNSQSYHCYMGGCNIHGDVISFIGLVRGMCNSDACKYSIERYGQGLSKVYQKKETLEVKNGVPQLKAPSLDPPQGIYEAFYSMLNLPAIVYDYLTVTRALSASIINGYGIKGIDEPWSILQELRDRFTDQDLVDSGLMIIGVNGKPRPSFYCPCVVFPHFHEGQVVYVSFRSLAGTIKTPCLPGRSKRVFNEDALSVYQSVFVFEGIINALSYCELTGDGNVIATLGVLSETSLATIRGQYRDTKLILAYDPDMAGLSAMENLNLECLDLNSWCRKLGYDGVPTAEGKTWDMNDFLFDLRERYEERAAIMEYCGGLSRLEAEQQSRDLLAGPRGGR